MNTTEKLIVKSVLAIGKDVKVNGMTLKNYKLKELFGDEIGIVRYFDIISILDSKIDDLFETEKTKEVIIFLNTITNGKWIFSKKDECYISSSEFEKDTVIGLNKKMLKDIFDILKLMYCRDTIPKDSEKDNISEEMKNILKEFEAAESQINESKGCMVTILSIIEAVSSKHPSINLLNVWECTLYQLMTSYKYLIKIDRENRVIQAMQSGTINSKDIDLEMLYWATENKDGISLDT